MEGDIARNGCVVSPSSSPPTPPSPLPISVGAGDQKYYFSPSPSPSPSPPFSQPTSSHTSTENLPLLHEKLPTPAPLPSPFSLDQPRPADHSLDTKSSCLKDL
ncbi:hypothetical protein Tsubulata_037554 [Turnera subulata]|uniref:Uncharacterized protein n=1 Tax=Turnera subulata TaxID=218843 RepID=A0A9Q0FF19_9ROSI|nr:hypothetical protein Tsubulata_037554 [Turnera subulata]